MAKQMYFSSSKQIISDKLSIAHVFIYIYKKIKGNLFTLAVKLIYVF